MTTEKNWEEMTWQEKREVRFQKWLNPANVKFNNPEAEKLYKQRVTRLIKAIKMEEPDRVPVMLPVGNFPAYYAGYDYYQCSRDYEKLKKAYIKFMDDFGDMDMSPSGMINSGPIAEKVQSNVIKVPGVGLPKDSSMHNINEGEYMKADEYDKLMLDPSDYMTRVNLPRTAKLFESFAKLPMLRHAQPGKLDSRSFRPGGTQDIPDFNRPLRRTKEVHGRYGGHPQFRAFARSANFPRP